MITKDFSLQCFICFTFLFCFLIVVTATPRQADAPAIVAASKSTSGIVCLPTIRTTTARASLWTGSYFHRAAFAAAIRSGPAEEPHLKPSDDVIAQVQDHH